MIKIALCRSAIIVAVFFSTLLSPASAQNTVSSPWEQQAFSGTAQSIAESAAKIEAKDADVVVLLEEVHYKFDEKGAYQKTRHLVYKLLTPQGVDDWSNIQAVWNPWHQRRPKLQARVVTAAGRAIDLDPKTIAEEPVDKTSDDTFSDRRQLRAPLPGVAPGALVETLVEWDEDAPFFDAGIVEQDFFGNRVPTEKSKLAIEYPAALPFHFEKQMLPDLKEDRQEKDGMVTVRFEQGPMPPVRRTESLLPYDVMTWPRVSFATGKDWHSIAARYDAVVNQEASSLPDNIVDTGHLKGKSRDQIAAILLDQLHRNVRYTGIEFSQASLIPHSPEQVWHQRFGDCKDKATLYVSMLRKAGIPAYMALLNMGPGEDVPSDLPGMGLFDHAIVYVPGPPALWIDATAEYVPVGYIPAPDQGRKALIASADSNALVTIPDMPSAANLLRERREVFMSDYGPASVIETSDSQGDIGANYRSYYGSQNKDVREHLEEYAKSAYVADALTSFEKSDPRDVSKAFELKLDIAKSKRGMTGLDSGEVAIPTVNMLDRFPDFIENASSSDKAKQEKISEDSDQNLDTPASRRKNDMLLYQNFVTRWEYTIHPPAGFQARALPPKREIQLGPATLTEDYTAHQDGTVSTVFTLDSVRKRWTAEQVEAAKEAVRAFRNQPVPILHFESTAAALLRQGKIKEALQEYRRVTESEPKKAIHHVQLASAYLDAGLGDAARAEARRGVEVEPDSAIAHKTLGWILEHDLVGRRFRTGWDRAGAVAEYRKAKALDPKDAATAIDLAILLEYDAQGNRYTPAADLPAAIQEYEQVKDKLADYNVQDNLAFALMRAGRYQELLDYLKTLEPTTTRRNLELLGVAETSGAAAAIERAGQISSSIEDRSKWLANAAQLLFDIRHYALWEQIAAASAEGSSQAAEIRNKISLFQGLTKHEDVNLPANDPKSLALRFMTGLFLPNQDYASLLDLFSHYTSDLNEKKLRKVKDSFARSARTAQYSVKSMPLDVLVDLIMRTTQFGVDGDSNGYRVRVVGLGGAKQVYYIGPEGKQLKILGVDGDLDDLGLTILDLLKQGNVEKARMWLDWAREGVTIQGGDDPLGGPTFPRVWNKMSPNDPALMRAAAACMAAATNKADLVIPVLEQSARDEKLASRSDVTQFALIQAYLQEHRYADAAPLAEKLAAKFPESLAVFSAYVNSLIQTGKLDLADNLITERLKTWPSEDASYGLLMQVYQVGDQEEKVLRLGQKLLSEGKAGRQDLNAAAWAALFLPQVPDEALDLGNRALKMSESKNASIMHTVASLYAEVGKTREARELILTTMDLWGADEPDSLSWYVFGRIAEQYGAAQTAMDAYKRVEAPDATSSIHGTTFELAQRRLKVLAQAAPSAPKSTISSAGHN